MQANKKIEENIIELFFRSTNKKADFTTLNVRIHKKEDQLYFSLIFRSLI